MASFPSGWPPSACPSKLSTVSSILERISSPRRAGPPVTFCTALSNTNEVLRVNVFPTASSLSQGKFLFILVALAQGMLDKYIWKEISSKGAQRVKTRWLHGAWLFYPFPKWSPGSTAVSAHRLLAQVPPLVSESSLRESLEWHRAANLCGLLPNLPEDQHTHPSSLIWQPVCLWLSFLIYKVSSIRLFLKRFTVGID